jgi:hypothetical protein
MASSGTTESFSGRSIASSMLDGASLGIAGAGTGAVAGGVVVVAAVVMVAEGGACSGAVVGDMVVVDGDEVAAASWSSIGRVCVPAWIGARPSSP